MADEALDPFRGYKAALPHLRDARAAYHAAMTGGEDPSHLSEAARLLRRLVMMARTTGGTAGPDYGLRDACEEAQTFLAELQGDSNAR